ncbi:MAG: DUF1653 domain-containing protein [Patescibacteria group bacterium]
MDREIPLGIYKHYKGNYYLIIGVAKHSETLEDVIIYVPLYKPENTAMWVRPINMFFENVKVREKIIPRFQYIGSQFPEK